MKRSFLVFCTTLLSFVLVVPTGAQRTGAYRILVGNDDGVRAPGLAAVAEALQAVGEVIIVGVAPKFLGKWTPCEYMIKAMTTVAGDLSALDLDPKIIIDGP